MTKLFLIAALMTLSLVAFAEEVASTDTANENCDVSVVSTGGETDASTGDAAATGTAAGRR